MSFTSCIDEALKDRKFGKKKRDEIVESYEAKRDEYIRDGFDEQKAGTMAASEAVEEFDHIAKERKRRQLAHAMKIIQIDQRIGEYKNPTKLWEMANSYIDIDDNAPWGGFIMMQDVVRSHSHELLWEMIQKHGRKGVGLRNRAVGSEKIVDELYELNSSGDKDAAGFAKAWEELTDHLIRRFRAAGGSIASRDDWRLPQQESRWALHNHSQDTYVTDAIDRVDWNKVRDFKGRRITSREEQKKFLESVYMTKKTEGHIKPPEQAGDATVGNQLDKHRYVVWKDADSWKFMHNKYGEGSVFEVMMGHIDLMASRIAMIETFGPNPALMQKSLKAKILHNLAKQDKANGNTMLVAKAQDKLRTFDTMVSVINRENSLPEMNRFGMTMAFVRNFLTSAMLGSASLLAIPTDMTTIMRTARFNKTPAGKTLGRYLRLMNPASDVDRQAAIRFGLIAENASQMAYAQKRLMGIDTHGPAIARWFSDVTMRASLMAPHTQAARWSFQMELMGAMAQFKDTALDDLPFADMFRRYGITENDWRTMRSIELTEHGGAKFLVPNNLYKSTGPASEPAVPSGHVRMYHGGGLRGTKQGADTGGSRWVTSSRIHAQGYADKAGGELWYVDVPRSNKIFDSSYPDQTVDQGFTVQLDLDAGPFGGFKPLKQKTGVNVREAELVSDKFMNMILTEGKYAVPDASIRGATVFKGATQAGTFHGELLNSAAMFKNFPMTLVFTHIRRGLQQETMMGKASYLTSFAIGMTFAGALGLQMREIAKGKEPRPMGVEDGLNPIEAAKFWGSAFITGGGGAIFADFLFSDLNRFGGGLKETLAGPVVKVATDFLNLTVGNAQELATGEDTNALPEAIRFAKQVTPGSSTWWSRLILDRLMWDQLEKLSDPKAYSKWRRQQRKMKRDYGQKFWWKRGETRPEFMQ